MVSPLVLIPKKNGEVRLCIDMRRTNKAINRERHASPTVDDLVHNLNGAMVSKNWICDKVIIKYLYHPRADT